MALMATTSLAVDGRGEIAMAEHQAIVDAIISGKAQDAYNCLGIIYLSLTSLD